MARSGLDSSREVSLNHIFRDVSTFGQRAKRFFLNGENAAMAIGGMAGLAFFLPAASELALFGALAMSAFATQAQRKAGLPMQVPKSANTRDPKEIAPGTKAPTQSQGIVFLGNERDTGEEIWLTDTQARTHMMFLGTTGSGKTEFLISVVFNALVHGSGLIYVDGKADNSLYGKLYSMARAMGREDDVLLINFQTGAKDIFGAQPRKMSNTLNMFANGSSGMLSQLVMGLMSTAREGGKSDIWENRAFSFIEALMPPLVYLRDHYGLLLDVDLVRNYFNLEPLVELLTQNMDRLRDDFGATQWSEKKNAKFPGIGVTMSGLASYIDNLPGFNLAKPVNKQEPEVHQQHGFVTMQLVRTFNSLADTYGYIMRTPLAEIDFYDVFINRRILIVLLPALEKSPSELANLGKIIVAAIKTTMAVGLGAEVEGDWSKVIDAKPTNAPSPFMCVLDEYGYYSVEGFAILAAQARSLGFSAIFAAQDKPGFEKSSKEEAASTLANTRTKFCGAMECTETVEYFKKVAGEAFYSRTGGFNNDATSILSQNYRDNQAAQVEKMARISDQDLREQLAGEWHLFNAGRIVRMNSFFSSPKKVKKLRTNHFIEVPPPPDAATRRIKAAREKLTDQLAKGFFEERDGKRRYVIDDALTPQYADYAEIVLRPDAKLAAAAGFERTLLEFDRLALHALDQGSFVQSIAGALEEVDGLEGLPDDLLEKPFRRSAVDDTVDMDDETDAFNMEFDEDIDFSAAVEEAQDDVIFGDELDEALSAEDSAGTLDRDATQEGVAAIEGRLGRAGVVADVIASQMTFEMSSATQYPTTSLGNEPNLEDFFEVSRLLQAELRESPDPDGAHTKR